MNSPDSPMTPAAKLALVALAAGLALILIAAARRSRPSGISRALESEDRAFDDTELDPGVAAFDDRIAPDAPL